MTYKSSLPPAFAGILSNSGNSQYFDYYTGPFAHYESFLLSKHDVVSDVIALNQIIPETKDSLIEIGAGNGRVIHGLTEKFGRMVAIEKSPDSVRLLQERFASRSNVEVVNKDFLDYAPSRDHKVDGVVIGSLSINLFLEDDLDNILEQCERILSRDGSIYFGCFDDSSLADFEKYTGRVGASTSLEEYIDEEQECRLMISNTMYLKEEQYLMQNWFVDMHGSNIYPPFCFSALVEKIWTLETLQPYLDSWGFSLSKTSEFRIHGGGGDGLLARMCKCSRA